MVGVDEAGRGPLAGPVVAAAFMILPGFRMSRTLQKQLRDSKNLSPKKRLEFYKFFDTHPHAKWGIGIVSERVIDKINILQATRLAMKKALSKMRNADFVIADGQIMIDTSVPQKSVIQGDGKVFSCAAASIMAKVTRDRIMMKYHTRYPLYGFDRNKGYGTKAHMQTLREHGPCPIHRKTFAPLREKKNPDRVRNYGSPKASSSQAQAEDDQNAYLFERTCRSRMPKVRQACFASYRMFKLRHVQRKRGC